MVDLDRTAPRTCHGGSELIDVLHCDYFPVNSCSCKMASGGRGIVSANFWPVHGRAAACQSPRHSLTASLSHLLCVSNLLTSRALNTHRMHLKMNHFASHQTERTLVKASCRAVFQMAFSRRDLSDIWNCVLNESVRWLVSFHCILCCEFCLAHFCHGIPERNDCWLRVAPQRDLSTTKLKKTTNLTTLSIVHGSAPLFLECDTAHDVLIRVFCHRNARY